MPELLVAPALAPAHFPAGSPEPRGRSQELAARAPPRRRTNQGRERTRRPIRALDAAAPSPGAADAEARARARPDPRRRSRPHPAAAAAAAAGGKGRARVHVPGRLRRLRVRTKRPPAPPLSAQRAGAAGGGARRDSPAGPAQQRVLSAEARDATSATWAAGLADRQTVTSWPCPGSMKKTRLSAALRWCAASTAAPRSAAAAGTGTRCSVLPSCGGGGASPLAVKSCSIDSRELK